MQWRRAFGDVTMKGEEGRRERARAGFARSIGWLTACGGCQLRVDSRYLDIVQGCRISMQLSTGAMYVSDTMNCNEWMLYYHCESADSLTLTPPPFLDPIPFFSPQFSSPFLHQPTNVTPSTHLHNYVIYNIYTHYCR